VDTHRGTSTGAAWQSDGAAPGTRQTGGVELGVRELGPDEMHVRVDYFHGASDAHLQLMGVDRDLLPPRDEWLRAYAVDAARPREEQTTSSLAWERNGAVVGFGSIDRITYGDEAFFHLHLLDEDRRQHGLGARFVRLSAARFIELFALRHLLSEPNAFNVAPNRALQRAGFRYLYTHETTPGPFNPRQPVTRWVLDADDLVP
jgi:RimJ/RimL family protein N-acetyltransferase